MHNVRDDRDRHGTSELHRPLDTDLRPGLVWTARHEDSRIDAWDRCATIMEDPSPPTERTTTALRRAHAHGRAALATIPAERPGQQRGARR